MIPKRRPWSSFLAGWLMLALGGTDAWAKIQFDVFPGYDNSARAGAWYPVAIEVLNDGPSFNAVVEINGGQGTVRVPVELPTNTRKRFSVPLFNVSRNFLSVDCRLLDERGKVRDEQTGKRVNVQGWEIPLMGALPGSFSGAPLFPEIQQAQAGWQPRVARLQPELFPDNPIALEGLNSLYLNSARALELKEPQVRALEAWVYAGGQLIVAVDQPADVNATPWLRSLMPADIGALSEERIGTALEDWIRQGAWNPQFSYKASDPAMAGVRTPGPGRRNPDSLDSYSTLAPDSGFGSAAVPVLALQVRDGRAAGSVNGKPLFVEAPRGRGQVVLLSFNPEREPVRSWTLRPWFFARLADVPSVLFKPGDRNIVGGRGLDGVFATLVETRQVQKLPVGFLLLLLVAYLVVIGPFDQWWLRKINRPMLTWITFPLYVVSFSLLIYFIGYKLRAGQTEWNELQVVDVLPQGDGTQAALRGWTFGSLYSPANETYTLGSALQDSAIRGEFRGLWGAVGEPVRMTVTEQSQGFGAEVFVPVWTSAMTVSDWEETTAAPLLARSLPNGSVEVQNALGRRMGPVWVVSDHRLVTLPELPSAAVREIDVSPGAGTPLSDLTAGWEGRFQVALGQREQTFGGGEKNPIDQWSEASVAASFPSYIQSPNGSYLWPSGFDLAPVLRRGDRIVLAWLPDTTLTAPLNQFETIRNRKGTLLRLVVSSVPRP
ncbi:MAG: hypothetical protein JNL10_16035 [Verrucomicrobiales bacterium]|nr:hypothetical protein [Verrucomicrobiales bacterium]